MQEPLVSVLIPVFNSEATIEAAIESCLVQTYGNIEIILLDDGSSDSTAMAVKKYQQIKFLRNEINAGRPNARNTLLKEAKGEFIAWLDADDTMLPERVEKQVDFMLNHPEVDIAGSWILTDNPVIRRKKFPTKSSVITAYLWFKNCMVQPAIISKNFYNAEQIFYNPAFYFMQDYELWYRLRNTKVFANIPEYLTHYHFTSAIDTANKNVRYKDRQSEDELWRIKWAENSFGLAVAEQMVLQKFLKDGESLSQDELKIVLKALKNLYHHFNFNSSNESKLVIKFFLLLVYRNFNWLNRLLNVSVLGAMVDYRKMKAMYLIQ